jgi:hypothetical protein
MVSVTLLRVTVIIPGLSPPVVFAAAVILNEPFPFLVEGVILEIVNHGTLLAGRSQTPLAVTPIVILIAGV